MLTRTGVVLLDGSEVILKVFQLQPDHRWHRLTGWSQDLIEPDEIIESLLHVFQLGNKTNIKQWVFLARNLPDETIKTISQAIKRKIQLLTLDLEQELICRGVL